MVFVFYLLDWQKCRSLTLDSVGENRVQREFSFSAQDTTTFG